MKVKYPHTDQLRLLFTDTDSLAYAVQTENIYEDMASDAVTKYDSVNTPLITRFTIHQTVKHLGFSMKEFVGLGPKCYAFLCTGKVDRNIFQHSSPVEK